MKISPTISLCIHHPAYAYGWGCYVTNVQAYGWGCYVTTPSPGLGLGMLRNLLAVDLRGS
jgi:hypothetical protein